jgi:hypothetical protein
MGSAGNPMGGGPVGGGIARKIIESLNARGVSPQQPGPSGSNPEAAGDQLSKSMSELRGADPSLLFRQFNDIKKTIVQALPQVAFVVPIATKHLGKMLEACNGFLKEIEQAQNVEGAVSKGGNIGHTAAMGQQAEPEQGGAMPAMGGPGIGM